MSGTGKTTLSADPERALIGDDEHGWGPKGVFNFEGGCYAKAINLTAKAEPEIYAASNQFGALLENVILDPVTGEPDYTDVSLTENTRSSYPIDFIPGHVKSGQGSNPRAVIMLTADAYGVLPPLAKLTTDQAMYHFLSGYTAKVAGTERGLGSEPQATFSTCFGAPFMPRHPSEYAALLREKVEATGAECWLVNTGWTGGTFGVGSRIPLNATRAMIRAILSGGFKDIGFIRDSYFGFDGSGSLPFGSSRFAYTFDHVGQIVGIRGDSRHACEAFCRQLFAICEACSGVRRRIWDSSSSLIARLGLRHAIVLHLAQVLH